MHINSLNDNRVNTPIFNGTLKIYGYNNKHQIITEKSAKYIERVFSKRTEDTPGNMRVLLLDRYNVSNAQSDKIFFSTDNKYTDCIDIHLKKHENDNDLVEKFVNIFYKFKQIKDLKENIAMMFK